MMTSRTIDQPGIRYMIVARPGTSGFSTDMFRFLRFLIENGVFQKTKGDPGTEEHWGLFVR